MSFTASARTWPSGSRIIQFTRVSQIPNQVLEGPDTYKFRLNPNKLKIERKKIEKWVLTDGGHERTDRGQDLIIFSYSGFFGVFRTDEPAPGKQVPSTPEEFDIRNTVGWQKFVEFEQFFLNSEEEEIHMNYWGSTINHIGSIGKFSYDVDADRPFIIAYNFEYTALPDDKRPVLKVTDRNIVNRPNGG